MKNAHQSSTEREAAVPSVAAASDSWTIGRLLDWTASNLGKRGAESPRLDAEVLLAHALSCRRIELYTRYDEPAAEVARARFRDLVRQRLEGCPVAYLVGRKEFYALEFEVNRSVLIPRPESEFVVLECLRLAKSLPAPRILDLGTGSGNLAVTIAKHLPNSQVSVVDISPEALEMARRNAAKHGVAERIRFLEGNLFGPIGLGERFDFIVSNPPYIPQAEIERLPIGVRQYEPHRALDGGSDGFQVLERILKGAVDYLNEGGYLIVEIGSPQERPVRERFAAIGQYELFPTIFDYSRHPRVLYARKRSES